MDVVSPSIGQIGNASENPGSRHRVVDAHMVRCWDCRNPSLGVVLMRLFILASIAAAIMALIVEPLFFPNGTGFYGCFFWGMAGIVIADWVTS